MINGSNVVVTTQRCYLGNTLNVAAGVIAEGFRFVEGELYAL